LEWVRILFLFSAVFAAELLIKNFESAELPFVGMVLITGFLAIAVMHVFELVITRIFDHSIWMRRMILGDEYIEGVWIDRVIDQDAFGVISIHVRDGALSMTGEQFRRDGRITATWDDYVANFSGNTLRAIYEAPQFREGSPSEVHGFSTYVFHGVPGKAPTYYSGLFADASHEGRRCQLQGFKVTDAKTLTELANPQQRGAALKRLQHQFEAEPGRESYGALGQS
jgi:hypothetical protein